MDEYAMLQGLREKNPLALEQAIGQYSAYVSAVIRGRGGSQLQPQDVEELTSDVFVSLWEHAETIDHRRVKSWLGSVARNHTVDYLRRQRLTLPLEEDTIVMEDGLWEQLDRMQRARLVRDALGQLNPQDREIFHRRYDLCQNSRQIAKAMGLPASTVRTRLSRGRTTMKQLLLQGGICDEAAL